MVGRFRNHDAQDSVLQAGFDGILVDAGGEAEGAMEFPNGTLGDPVLGFVLALSFFRRLGDLARLLRGAALFSSLFFDSGFVALRSICHVTGDTAAGFVSPVGGVFPLGAAFDDQGVGVGEFNVDVLLIETGQFALELVGVFVLADIEFRLEGADGGVGEPTEALGVVVVDQSEELGHFVIWEAWEERHCSNGLARGFADSVGMSWKIGDDSSASLH